MRLALVIACVACAAPAAPTARERPAAAPPPRIVDMGEFSVELPPGAWRPTADAAALTADIPEAAGLDESGGGFALYDPATDVIVRGFDGSSSRGGSEPAALAAALHAAAEGAFTATWTVTRAEGGEAGAERRRSFEAEDRQGLSMQALVLTVVEDGVAHGAGVQCVWKTAEAARAELCRKVLASLRRGRVSPPSSAAPSARSS